VTTTLPLERPLKLKRTLVLKRKRR